MQLWAKNLRKMFADGRPCGQWSCKLLIRLWLTEQQAVGHHISYHASKSVLSKDASGQCNEAEGVISRNVCCFDISRPTSRTWFSPRARSSLCVHRTNFSFPIFPKDMEVSLPSLVNTSVLILVCYDEFWVTLPIWQWHLHFRVWPKLLFNIFFKGVCMFSGPLDIFLGALTHWTPDRL